MISTNMPIFLMSAGSSPGLGHSLILTLLGSKVHTLTEIPVSGSVNVSIVFSPITSVDGKINVSNVIKIIVHVFQFILSPREMAFQYIIEFWYNYTNVDFPLKHGLTRNGFFMESSLPRRPK